MEGSAARPRPGDASLSVNMRSVAQCPHPALKFEVAQTVKCLSTMQETRVQSLVWDDPLEKEMAIHSSTIAWKIPSTEEPGRLQSMGAQELNKT